MKLYQNLAEILPLLPEDHPYKGRPYVLSSGDDEPDILIIKPTPSYADMKTRMPWSGEDGRLIRMAVLNNKKKAYYATLSPFMPEAKVKAKEIAQYSDYLSDLIRKSGATTIALFGSESVNNCKEFGIPYKRFTDIANRVFEHNGYRFIVFPHPAIYARTPTMYTELTRRLRDFLNPLTSAQGSKTSKEDYRLHRTLEDALPVLEAMGQRVAFDIETTGLDYFNDRILTVQMSDKIGEGHSFLWEIMTPEQWEGYLQQKDLVMQNGSFDKKFLKANGVSINISEDTMLMHSLVDETPGTHSMEHMAQRYLQVDKWADTVDYDNMESVDLEVLGQYGARDTDLTLRLANIFAPKVRGRYINKVLHDAQNAIAESEFKGIRVDRDKAFQFQSEITKALHDRQEYMADVYGLKNASSPKQILEVFKELDIPLQKVRGRISTDEEALLTLGDVPIARDILEYRHLTKASGTYLRAILEKSEEDGRYHPEFRLANTETGRLTESLIMLIPRPDNVAEADLGKQYQYRLRELFIPDPYHVMVGADYAGLEISMGAHISGDLQLIRDVINNVDIHSVVAIQAFNLDESETPYSTLKKRVSAKFGYERTLAKAGVFAWLYDGDENTLARNLNIPLELATKIMNSLRTRYAGVTAWKEATRLLAREHGKVTTPWGRTRHFNFSSTFSPQVIAAQYRESTNMPIQGMATDMNLKAYSTMYQKGIDVLFPFHDAVYAQALEGTEDIVAQQIQEIMESSLPGPVPFRADVKVGEHWGALG